MDIQITPVKMPKLLSEMTDEDKGEFVEMSEKDVDDIVKGLQVDENIELGPEFNFDNTYDAQYYSEKFPGFESFVYEILENETIELNRNYGD